MDSLTRFSKGGIREAFALTYPVFLAQLSSCVMSFCDRCFLARSSLAAFEGACLGGYLVLFFQLAITQLTSINQAFISRAAGEKMLGKIAPYTWQMIWASLLTILVMVPIGLIASHYYFDDTAAGNLGRQYFLILLFGNFLFALGATLAGFQSGIGETKILTKVAIIANVLNLALNYPLIFGIEGLLPPLGPTGAALGTVLAQGVSCLLLFRAFIKHKRGKEFRMAQWHFSPPLFFKLLRAGFFVAARAASSLIYWLIAVKIVSARGGDYLLTLSYGSVLYLFTQAFVGALRKSALSLFSFFWGEKDFFLLRKSLRSVLLLLFTIFLALGIPLVLFSKPLIALIVSVELSSQSLHLLQLASLWFWVYFFLVTTSTLASTLLVAMEREQFMMWVTLILSLLHTLLPYYLAFKVFSCSPDKVWMVNWICCGFGAGIAFWKAFIVLKRKKETLLQEKSGLQSF